jgi:hypothetical protein
MPKIVPVYFAFVRSPREYAEKIAQHVRAAGCCNRSIKATSADARRHAR